MSKIKIRPATIILLFLFTISALVILSSYISPQFFWPGAYLVLFLVPVLLVNVILLVVLLIRRSWWLALPLLILGSGLFFLPELYAWSSANRKSDTEHHFSVLSYNASFFRAERVFSEAYYSPDNNLQALRMNEWIRENGADIICLQEFFDDENSEIFNNIQTIGEQAGYTHYFLTKPRHDNGVRRGLITFSKFPIIQQGPIFLSENRYNGATFVDLLIDTDTVRVINLHLESLNLSERTQGKSLVSVIKSNPIVKSRQADDVMRFVIDHPHPTVVCGDFNEVPNSFLYQQFDQTLTNAFEERGQGFGFTYQGTSPVPLLRIDNQFYSPSLHLTAFATYDNACCSDHFPIEARYRLP